MRPPLDDFGSGCSSLAYLMPGRFVGLAFIRAILNSRLATDDGARIAEVMPAVVTLAHALGMRIVVEGPESPEAEAFAMRAGCGLLQGYLDGRSAPMPLARHGHVPLPGGVR